MDTNQKWYYVNCRNINQNAGNETRGPGIPPQETRSFRVPVLRDKKLTLFTTPKGCCTGIPSSNVLCDV